jgi:hypothetical protein
MACLPTSLTGLYAFCRTSNANGVVHGVGYPFIVLLYAGPAIDV